MRCISCGATDKWENVDEYRLKPTGMCICTGCGFVSYPSRWKSKEEIVEHYRKDYRKPPTHSNLFTGQRKLHFHASFLSPVFEEWNTKGKKTPVIAEVGAAYGMALKWMKDVVPGAEVHGTELTLSFRRNAFHEFGINLTEEFDDSRKYDLIMSYKVAEHQLDFDHELKRYIECLNDDGLIYISVPTWFASMSNFGLPGFDIEYYYDPNHINVWTKEIFESILTKAGLEIIRQDHVMYDSTYLCKKSSAERETEAINQVEFVKESLKRIKKASDALTASQYDTAISIWPDIPIAHINRAEMIRAQAFKNGWEWIKENIIDFSLKNCPGCAEILLLAADFCMRANQWELAIQYSEECLKRKPETPQALKQLINIMREMAMRAPNEEARIHYFSQARRISAHLRLTSPQHFRESLDFTYLFNSKIPYEGENAKLRKSAVPNELSRSPLPMGRQQPDLGA